MKYLTVVIVVLFILLWVLGVLASAYTATGIILKDVVQDGETYFVFQPDGSQSPELLANEDAYLFGKVNSGDLLVILQEGRRYKLTIVGFRIPPLSMFKNILRADPLPLSDESPGD